MTKSQQLVLSAVQRGMSDPKAIASWTTYTPREVRELLLGLQQDALVIKRGEYWYTAL